MKNVSPKLQMLELTKQTCLSEVGFKLLADRCSQLKTLSITEHVTLTLEKVKHIARISSLEVLKGPFTDDLMFTLTTTSGDYDGKYLS